MASETTEAGHGNGSPTALLALGALGVVYGDIGTSPLYAMRESMEGTGHQLAVLEPNVLGILSLIVWSLIIVISIKYLVFVMRADNEGEGGILALTSLIPISNEPRTRRRAMILLGLFGTALLYGDGMITPAISVLSAIEGTEIAAPQIADYAVPIAGVILVGLFVVQRLRHRRRGPRLRSRHGRVVHDARGAGDRADRPAPSRAGRRQSPVRGAVLR